MSTILGNAYVRIRPDTRGFGRDTEREIRAQGAAIGDALADSIGRSKLSNAIGAEVKRAAPQIREQGRKSGGVLAQGMRSGFVRRSPLIVAAVTGAMIAGAPAVTAAAGTLFAGIGAVAAAQSEEVRTAWSDLWADVRDGAVSDAAVLVPTYVNMAARIGAAFTDLRPQIREAFIGTIPLVDALADGVIRFAQNAMPGMIAAIDAGAPVFASMEEFLATVGTGFGDLFQVVSRYSPAAAESFAALGEVLAVMLPLLGEVMGVGAEIAADVLPLIADGARGLHSALSLVAPILPEIVQGLIAMKAARGLGAIFTRAAGPAAKLSGSLASGAPAGNKFSRALGSMGRAAGPVGLALAGVVPVVTSLWDSIVNAGKASIDTAGYQRDLAFAFEQTKGSIDSTIEAMAAQKLAEAELSNGMLLAEYADRAGVSMNRLNEALMGSKTAQREVNATLDEWFEKQANAAVARGEDAGAIADWSRKHEEAKDIIAQLMGTMGGAREQYRLKASAIRDATAALDEHNAASLLSVDAALAARSAELGVRNAVQRLNEVRRDGESTALDKANAEHALAQSLDRAGQAAVKAAQDEAELQGQELSATETARIYSSTVQGLASDLGVTLSGSLATTVGNLAKTSSTTAETSAKFRDLGVSIHGVPDGKRVKVSANAVEKRAEMEALGYSVETLPNGDVYITANTAAAEAAINHVARTRTTTIFVREVMTQRAASRTSYGVNYGGGRASGGPIFGPGTETSDSILTALSNNEHVISAKEVRGLGGHDAVEALRALARSGAFLNRATGGPVTYSAARSASTMSAPSSMGGGDLHLHVSVDPSQGHARDQVEEALFQLRRLKRGGPRARR